MLFCNKNVAVIWLETARGKKSSANCRANVPKYEMLGEACLRIETLEGLFSELGPKHYATGTCNADLFFLIVRSTWLSILDISALICYCTHLSKIV